MSDITKEIREHMGHQWSNRTYVQSDRVRDIMRRAADQIEHLHATVKNIATQKTTEELIAEGGMAYEDADFEGGYDAIIHIARRAIAPATPSDAEMEIGDGSQRLP